MLTISNEFVRMKVVVHKTVKTKTVMKEKALRIDFSEEPLRFEKTEEGFLRGEARVARVGVQSYQDGNGGVHREYRPVSEVFSQDSINSFKNTPITLGHPSEKLVTSENAKRLSIGLVGENIRPDGEWLVMPLTITDEDAIKQIEKGDAVELSGGYIADVDNETGEYEGIQYDAVQRSIRGNHVAVVERARAGSQARINLDSGDAVAVESETINETNRSDGMSEKAKTVRIDGIEYDVQPEVERHLSRLDEQYKEIENERDQLKQDAEQQKAKLDEALAELEKVRTERSDEAIQQAARERVELERNAARVIGDDADFEGMSDREIREAVVKAVHDSADLSEASDIYVQARFDAAIETHKAHADSMSKQRETAVKREPVNDGYSEHDKRKDVMSALKDAYKNSRGMTANK